MLLKISDKYRVTGQPLNFVLEKRIISKKTPGKVSWTTTGYYASLEGLLSDMIKERIIDTDGELKQVIESISEAKSEIIEAIKDIK